MALTEQQEAEIHASTIKTARDISWIRERLEKGDKKLDDCQERQRTLEAEHSVLKGRLGAFILGLTFIASLLVNGVLWVWSHLGSK